MTKNVITISREFGSGGRTIGKLVAKELGIEFYDKDLVRQAAQKSGLREKYVELYGEFAPSSDRFAYNFVDIDEDKESPLKLLWKAREQAIVEFAQKPCVIVGVGADYVLRDRDDALKVFLFADEETKNARIVEMYGEAKLKDRNRVHEMDVRRSLNYKYYTGQEWGKAQNYDLALNRSSLGIDKCVELIVSSAK